MKCKARKGLAIILALVLVLCLMPAVVFADGEGTYEDGTYKMLELTSNFGMFGNIIDKDASKVVFKDGAATLVIVTNSAKRYDQIMLGTYDDKIKTGTEDGIKGFANEDGSEGLTYVVPVDSELFAAFAAGTGEINYIVRYIAKYDDKHDADWYKYTKGDPFLKVTGIEKVSDSTDIPVDQAVVDADAAAAVDEKIAAIGEVTLESEEKIAAARAAYDALTDDQKALVTGLDTLKAGEDKLKELKDAAAAEAAHTPLTITNKTSMFKADEAYLNTAEDGSKTLEVTLSGSSYENLFRGTYEEAKANGNDRTKWIKGTKVTVGDKEKVKFIIPVADGDGVIPLVSISNSYLAKFEAGENPIERAFYPRQMVLDREAKTLVVGDYESTKDLEIVNEVKMFKPTGAKLTTVGGPNSNNYATTLELAYGSNSFDKAFIGNASDASSDKVTVVDYADGGFAFKLRWIDKAGQPDTVHNLMEEPFTVSFHSVSKDAWYERVFTVQEDKGKLIITEATKQDEDAIVKVVSVKDKNGKTVAFTLGDVKDENKLTKPIAVKVNSKVENEESIEIKWQMDLKVPKGTEFPVTVEFEYKNKDENFFIYHFNGTAWEVAGEGAGGKAAITFESLSPTGLVSVNNPNTGDHSDAFLWGAVLVISAAAAVAVAVKRRKEEN